jgi:Ser-tRNA(Ala) deacylase AlaX
MPCTVNAELLFMADAYLQTASARVVAVHEHAIELDRPRRHALMRLHTALRDNPPT